MSRSSSSPRAVAVTAAPPNPATLISRLFLSFFFLFSLSLCVSPSLAAHAQPAPLPTLAQPHPQRPDDDGHHHHYNVNQRARQQPSAPPYTTAPLVTPAPSAAPDEQQRLQDQGFRQETYYTCITAPSGREHCGWHTPLVRQPKHGSGASPVLAVPRPGRRVTDARLVLAVVAALAGVFVVGLM